MEMTGGIYENKNVRAPSTSDCDDHVYDDINNYQENQTTTNPGTCQNSEPGSAGRCYRLTAVVLLLLCVLLLSGVTVLWIKYNNLMTENNQLQSSQKNLSAESNQLQANYDNMRNQTAQEKDNLQKKLNTLVSDMKNVRWTLFGTSIYYMCAQSLNWIESRQACRDRGADLVIINSQEEHNFVNILRNYNWVWIGLSDSDTEGLWKWVDGSLLATGYWYTNQPDGGKISNCVLNEGKWYDRPCTQAAYSK